MRKYFFFLIFISLSVLVSAQTNKGIIGHWKLCSSDWGYYECLIGDSTLDWLNPKAFNMSGSRNTYYVVNNSIIHTNGYQDDSLSFEIIDSNKIILTSHDQTYNLIRIKDDLLNYYSYDCTLKMSYLDFMELLDNQLRERMIINNKFCPEAKKEKNKNLGVYDDDLMEEEFLVCSEAPPAISAYGYLNSSKILETNINTDFESEIVSTTYNNDSTSAIILFNSQHYCYADYDVFAKLNNKSELEIRSRYVEPICKERCTLQYEMKIHLRNYVVDEIIFIDDKR